MQRELDQEHKASGTKEMLCIFEEWSRDDGLGSCGAQATHAVATNSNMGTWSHGRKYLCGDHAKYAEANGSIVVEL